MSESRSAVTVALIIISLTSGTTQAFKCFSCVDSPAAHDPACRANTFDPTSSSIVTQNPTTQVSITLITSSGRFSLTSSDFDCSTGCAVYTSASQSITARSCYIKANIKAAFPDVQIQNCHRDYCNTSPMLPDTPPPSSGKLQCYFCYDSVQFGSSVYGCSDSNFQPAQIPDQQYGTSLQIGVVIIPPAYFDCSACQVVKIPSMGLTVRACSTTFDLAKLRYSDIQTQTCHSNRCNGYPLITDDNSPRPSGAASSFQVYLYMRIGLIVAAALPIMFIS